MVCFIVVQSKYLLYQCPSKTVFFAPRSWIGPHVWFEYWIYFYLPQHIKLKKPQGAILDPLLCKLNNGKYQHVHVREIHCTLIVLLKHIFKNDAKLVKCYGDKIMNAMSNEFINHGIKHCNNNMEMANEKKIKKAIASNVGFIQCRSLTSIHICRSKVASRFHVNVGDFIFGFRRLSRNSSIKRLGAFKIVEIVQFDGLHETLVEIKDYVHEIVILGEVWLPSKPEQWQYITPPEFGNIYYIKNDEIPEYYRPTLRGQSIHVPLRAADIIEPLRPVRVCNQLNIQQAKNWHNYNLKSKMVIGNKIDLCYYGTNKVADIDKGGCFVYPVCERKECNVVGCVKHRSFAKLPKKWDVYHTCSYDINNKICLASSLHGANANNLFKAGTMQSVFKIGVVDVDDELNI